MTENQSKKELDAEEVGVIVTVADMVGRVISFRSTPLGWECSCGDVLLHFEDIEFHLEVHDIGEAI